MNESNPKLLGFSTDKPDNFKEVPAFYTDVDSNSANSDSDHLYVPNITKEVGVQPYRRVAVVERFFDIIYNVHVGLGGRSGRHAGQKRTYRTVRIDTFTFQRLIQNIYLFSSYRSLKLTPSSLVMRSLNSLPAAECATKPEIVHSRRPA